MRDECEGERAREICARGRSMYASKDSPTLAPEKVDFFFGDSQYEWDMHGVVDEEAKSPPEQKKKHNAGFSSDTVMPRTDTIVGAGPQIQWRRWQDSPGLQPEPGSATRQTLLQAVLRVAAEISPSHRDTGDAQEQ